MNDSYQEASRKPTFTALFTTVISIHKRSTRGWSMRSGIPLRILNAFSVEGLTDNVVMPMVTGLSSHLGIPLVVLLIVFPVVGMPHEVA